VFCDKITNNSPQRFFTPLQNNLIQSTNQPANQPTNQIIMSREDSQQALFQVGMPIRRAVLGDSYVDRSLAAGSSEFGKAMQEFTTAYCWGAVWGRPGLEKRERSLINIGMLAALGKIPELGSHVRGAVNNGVTETEIREALVQVCIYCGVPAGMDGFKMAEKVLDDIRAEGGKILT
jgi:4-carboxymuconolactone decarboxylase